MTFLHSLIIALMNACKVAAGRQEAVCVCVCVAEGARMERRVDGRGEGRGGEGKKMGGGCGRDLYIATDLTLTPTSRASVDCDPRGAAHQRRQARQHRLLSTSETPHICTKTSTHGQRRTCTHRHPLSLALSRSLQ